MSMPVPIQIVGGGLAGLTLGIALRKREIPVTIIEAGGYPRQRVCGEFISGQGMSVLGSLGLTRKLFEAGAVRAESAAFFLRAAGAPAWRLPAPALSLSRFAMDKLLADEFQGLGGELREGKRWLDGFDEGVVRAAGRRLQPVEGGWRWFGLKAHAENVSLTADLEMHLGENGYVGLCRLSGGRVNVCGLFRRHADDVLPSCGFDLLRGTPGSMLNERLARAEFDEDSFCSVAGLSLQPRRAMAEAECCIGDALTMVPPVTGNGMSLAFESAQLAAGPLAAYCRGRLTWRRARDAAACLCDETFSGRLAWAKRLHQAMFSPSCQQALFTFFSRIPCFWRLAFDRTR